ncbi:MAG: hypothetical protein M1836_007275 [Candelina mexicana]|nr:MAG: hypothetical protein M1836_007275 [Candelina mexicana]
MCLVNVKPSSGEEEIAIPPRPVRQPQTTQQQRPTSSHPSLSAARASPRASQSLVPVQYIEAIPVASHSPSQSYYIQSHQPQQQNRIIQQLSPHSSVITVRTSREYVPQHSPRGSVRFVDAAGNTIGANGGATAMRRGSSADKRLYVDEGRRSGSVTYATNPRHSTASHRSARERVVTIDDQGRRREYYR